MAKSKKTTKSAKMSRAKSSGVRRSTAKTVNPDSNNNLKYLAIIAVLALILYLAINKSKDNQYMVQTPVVDENTYPQIQSNEDLDKAIKDVDYNDPVKLDPEIKGLDADSSNL